MTSSGQEQMWPLLRVLIRIDASAKVLKQKSSSSLIISIRVFPQNNKAVKPQMLPGRPNLDKLKLAQ